MFCGVYKITCKFNGKFYIGSSKEINKRWYFHMIKLEKGKHENIHLQRAWDKYGSDNFEWSVLENTEENNLLNREQYYLDTLNPWDFTIGFNIGRSASGGDNLTGNPNKEDIIKRISNGVRKRYANKTDEEKKKYSESIMGENNPNYGNKWNKEQREKASKSHTGKIISKKTRINMSKAQKLIWDDLEKRKLWGKKLEKDGNPFYGKKHTKDTCEYLSEKIKERHKNAKTFEEKIKLNPNIRRVYINGFIYNSVSEAARVLNVCPATIIFRINSKNLKFKDYKYNDQGE